MGSSHQIVTANAVSLPAVGDGWGGDFAEIIFSRLTLLIHNERYNQIPRTLPLPWYDCPDTGKIAKDTSWT
jgi:hypothetical protein